MTRPNYVHLLPERDRMMAENYSQNADGSSNPTGEAKPQDAPHVIENVQAGVVVGKVVEAPEDDKPKGSTAASTKSTRKKR